VGRVRVGEGKSRGGEGMERDCAVLKILFKSHGPVPSLILRQIEALGKSTPLVTVHPG